MLGINFYDQVLRELLAATGGALFIGNVLALVRRRRRREQQEQGDLERAPVARTVLYALLGFVVMVWGLGSLIVAS